MRSSILSSPTTSPYLTGWDTNPRLASLFPSLGYQASQIVIENGDPPPEFSTTDQLHAHFDALELHHRKLFTQDRQNPLLSDPYCTLEKLWEGDEEIVHAPQQPTDHENAMFTLFPSTTLPQKPTVSTLASFRHNFASLTRNMFAHVDFTNVLVGGGAVLAALQPSDGGEYFNSDIDVFLYGLELDQARKKVVEIYEAVKKATTGNDAYSVEEEDGEFDDDLRTRRGFSDSDILCVRNLRSLILVGQYPRRHIQIVFRLYKSPAEILMGFDIDSCCFGYNGTHVYALPRGLRALTRRYNLVDMTRRSASYEYRLFKYAKRGFAIKIPHVHPDKIKQRGQKTFGDGLAKLLSLEAHELLTGYYRKKKGKMQDRGEVIHADREAERKAFSTETKGDMSHYQSVKIPFGKKWPLKRVTKYVATFVFRAAMCINYGPLQNATATREGTNLKEAFPPDSDDDSDIASEDRETPEPLHHALARPMVLTVNQMAANLDQHLAQYFSDRTRLLRFEETWMTENPGQQLLTGSFEPVLTTWDEWFKDAYSEREVKKVDEDEDEGEDADQDGSDEGDEAGEYEDASDGGDEATAKSSRIKKRRLD
ncbi:Protein mono-ADP-ribosyltransferase parp4 [Phlyctochytrium planicorne]|nr:Protein mono-ADP-ribosyltransferase parp4 [Phlyctochytrium planicorne]